MQNTEIVEYVLVTTRGGNERALEAAPTKEKAEKIMAWWVEDTRDPEEARKEFRIVKKTTTVVYEEV